MATIREPLKQMPELLSNDHRHGEPRPVLPPPLEGLVFGSSGRDVAFMWAIGSLLLAMAFYFRATIHAAVALTVLATAVVLYILVWHSAALSLQRLEVVSAVLIRVALIQGALLGVDAWIRHAASAKADTRMPAIPDT